MARNANAFNGIDRPLRVAYVLKRYPRFSETFIVNEILAHEAAGVELSIFALRPPADSHFQPAIARVRAPVTYLQNGSVRANDFWNLLQPRLKNRPERLKRLVGAADCEGLDVFQALQLAQMLQERGVDHIHAHFATSAASVARMASLMTGIPFSFTAHAKDIFHEYVDPAALQEKLTDAASVVTVSDFNREFLHRQFGCADEKLRRIYNGLPLESFPFEVPRNRSPLTLGVGRLVEKKGFSDLIAACAILDEQHIDFRCEIIGSGELEAALRHQIDESQLGGKVELRGSLPTDEVVRSFRRAAVLAAPCITASTGDRDGLPTVLLEAMAVGTPCVATSVTGIPEVVRNRKTGLLIEERNPAALAAALRQILNDEGLRVQLAQSARQLIEERFDIEQNSAQLRALFLPPRRPRRRTPQLSEAV
ncbi:MAG TPA: glycosyltransferase family 4 protein [Lacipirellulaceae bacterium]|jgi:glycosyltransferase involved in cell wall biosynthesis|nr:glycosyltransferase family 4 protein [Lacipirellulaceae bacterium]